MKAMKKDPIHKKIMATRNDYVDNEMFDQENQEKFFAEMAFRRSRTFSRTMNRKETMAMTVKTMKN